MDLAFWQSIVDTDFSVPKHKSPGMLIDELLSDLGSVKPVLREGAKYRILEVWIEQGYFTPTEMRYIAGKALHNLRLGLGEKETDSVFLRSYSILVLNMIIDRDNQSPFLSKNEVREWLDKALSYLNAEKDFRGFVEGKGWAHTMAHFADLFTFLTRNQRIQVSDLENMLNAILHKFSEPTDYVYTHLEDERLAFSIMAILRLNQVSLSFWKTWFNQILLLAGQSPWIDIYAENQKANMRHNAINLLRSLYFQLKFGVAPPINQDALLSEIETIFQKLDLGFYSLFAQPHEE